MTLYLFSFSLHCYWKYTNWKVGRSYRGGNSGEEEEEGKEFYAIATAGGKVYLGLKCRKEGNKTFPSLFSFPLIYYASLFLLFLLHFLAGVKETVGGEIAGRKGLRQRRGREGVAGKKRWKDQVLLAQFVHLSPDSTVRSCAL